VANPALRANLTARSHQLNTSRLDLASPDLEVIDWQLAHPDRPVPPQLVSEVQAWRHDQSIGAD
jgi:hypothetical protein